MDHGDVGCDIRLKSWV